MNKCDRCEQESEQPLTDICGNGWCWTCVEQTRHDAGKHLMARERERIVEWLRHYGGAGNEIAALIANGQHWKDQP